VSGRFAFLSRFGMKFVEVGGAGLASAACAYVLGQMGQQPPAPPPPIVQVMPPSEDAMRMARDEHALLSALVRKETERRNESAAQAKPENATQAKPENAASASSAAAKPAKAPAAQVRRNQKPEQAVSAEPQPRASEPSPVQPPVAAAMSAPIPLAPNPAAQPGRDGSAASAPSGGAEGGPIFALRQIPSLLMPDNERVFGIAPRPPMPVGEFLPSAM
jgi:hypothetical protein